MKKKINKSFVIISILAIIVTTLVMTVVYYGQIKKQVFSDLKSIAEIISEENLSGKYSSEVRITVIKDDGTVLYDSEFSETNLENHINRPEIVDALNMGEGKAIRKSDTLAQSIYYYAKRNTNGTIIRVGKVSQSVNAVMLSSICIALIIAIVLVGLSVLFSHFLTIDIITPINRIAEDLDHIDEGSMYPELIPFSRKIRSQHEEILEAVNVRQEFTANVTHELKTPLTAISGYAELMESGIASHNDVNHFSAEIKKSAERLIALINDIINLSHLDEGLKEETTEKTDIAEICKDTVSMLSLESEKKNISLNYEGPENAYVRASKEYIQEVTYNLIQNAIRYNKPDGKVFVKVVKDDGGVTLSVKDTGIGIPKEHQDRVFERFYRVDKSRSKELGGTGLGLAIVKHICSLTGGNIILSSQEGQGTCISINWEEYRLL